MIELVYGGSGSGKSEFAESEILKLNKDCRVKPDNDTMRKPDNVIAHGISVGNNFSNLFYVATMKVSDSEAQKKVERHRKLRAGKNFITIEASENIENATEFIISSLRGAERRSNLIKKANCQNACVLLECLSNLAANEMFKDGKIIESEKVVRKIESGLEKLLSVADNIVVVSNNIFDDGIDYDKTTREYQKTLAELNSFIAQKADKVSEIVAGIEVKVK